MSEPTYPAPRDPSERHEVMAQVREFWEREGRPESGEEALSAHDILMMHAAMRAREPHAD